MQEDKARFVDASQNHHAEIGAERFDGEVGIVAAFVGCAENGNQLTGETFRQNERSRAHQRLGSQQHGEQLPHAHLLSRAHVVTDDGNAARRHADHDGNDDLEELHHDAHYRHGDLGVLRLPEHRIQRAVLTEHVVDGRHCRHKADLGEKAGDAQRQRLPADVPVQGIVAGRGLDDFHVQQIPDGERGRRHLTDHRRHGRAHHAPFEAEDENRVEDDVDDGAGQRGDHGKFRVSVCADDGVHRLPEHIERNTERDIEEIFLRTAEGFLVDRAAEHGDDAVGKDEIHDGQDEAACHGQHNGVADAALGLADFASAQRHADKSAAAVADHDGDRQRHDCQRKHDGVGGVAVRAEIAGVGDEDLVNDVIQRAHQQRDDARNGVLPHQPAHALRPQELIS